MPPEISEYLGSRDIETLWVSANPRHAVVDPNNGRVPNANFGEYAVPLHADAPRAMDVIFVEEHEPHVNPLGVRGVGEIAMVGAPPAIANAVLHATGRRIRALPITPDTLL